MKRKDKKSNKAKEFLKKYQLGGTNYFADDTLMQNPYEYAPDLQTAQQQQLVQFNQPKNQQAYIPQPQPQGFGWDNAIPLISPAINLGIGIKSIIDSFGEKKRQQQYERAYKRDLERRREEARTSDYFVTPYGVPGTRFQSGGLYQPNQLDFFIDFYNQKEDQNDLTQQAFENYYQGKNQMYENQWRTKRSSGIQNTLSGAMGLAKTFFGGFQQGGLLQDTLMQRSNTDTQLSHLTSDYFNLIHPDTTNLSTIENERASYIWNYKKENPEMFDMIMGLNPDRPKYTKSKRPNRFYEKQEGGEYNPKVDLYSPEYDPNEFLGIENEVVAAQIEDKEASAIEQWLFQDEPELDELNIDYFNPESTNDTDSNNNILNKIGQQESGGDYGAKNPYSSATGKYQFTKVWAGQIKSFMNLPQTFSAEQVMDAFRNNPQAQEGFMQYVHENIYLPEIEKLRPLAVKFGLDDSKLERMLHYRGLADTRKRLQTGDFTVSAEEKARFKNPDILQYLNK